MALKKINVIEAKPNGGKKDTITTVAVNYLQVKTSNGTYVGEVVNKTTKVLTLKTDAGQVEIKLEDIGHQAGVVEAYNEAQAALKDATADVDGLKPVITKLGVLEITQHNCQTPLSPWSSVKLTDNEPAGSVRVSSTTRYKFANGDVASQVFEELLATALKRAKSKKDEADIKAQYDVNTYVQETLVASFDNEFFIDKDGDFDQERYDAVKKAIDEVAAKFKVASPLSTKAVVLPKPDFHERRYSLFSAEENLRLSEALPNTVSVSANVS